MKDAIALIKGIFDSTGKDVVRYSEIEHIDKHHEALKKMEKDHLVYVYFKGSNVYIEKNVGW